MKVCVRSIHHSGPICPIAISFLASCRTFSTNSTKESSKTTSSSGAVQLLVKLQWTIVFAPCQPIPSYNTLKREFHQYHSGLGKNTRRCRKFTLGFLLALLPPKSWQLHAACWISYIMHNIRRTQPRCYATCKNHVTFSTLTRSPFSQIYGLSP